MENRREWITGPKVSPLVINTTNAATGGVETSAPEATLAHAETDWVSQLSQELQSYHKNGMIQLGHIAFGQLDAKEALLAGPLMGTTKNMAEGTRRIGVVDLAGTYGIGKTAMTNEYWRLFEGFTPEDVAIIETDAELQPMRVGGGQVVDNLKIDNGDGTTSNRQEVHVIEGLVEPHHKIIRVPEKSRINYAAMPMLFDVAEYGIIQTSAGRIPLPEAVLMLNDFNSSDRKTVEVLSAAGQSRSDMLVVLDHDDNKLSTEDRRRLRNDDTPNPGEVISIVTLEKLNEWQSRLDQMNLPDSIDGYADSLIQSAKSKLESVHEIDEGFRLHRQVGRLTKILSLFEGEAIPDKIHADKALKFVVATRLGGLSKRNLGKVVDTFTDDVIKATH